MCSSSESSSFKEKFVMDASLIQSNGSSLLSSSLTEVREILSLAAAYSALQNIELVLFVLDVPEEALEDPKNDFSSVCSMCLLRASSIIL